MKYLLFFFITSNAFAFLETSEIQKKFVNKNFSEGSKVKGILSDAEVVNQNKSKKMKSDLTRLPASSDFRYRDTPTKRQFGSTCSAFGLVAAMENALYDINQTKVDISERHLWSKYRKYSSDRAVRTALNNGAVTDEKYWPMNKLTPKWGYKRNANNLLLDAPYIDDSVELAVAALSQGNPVYLGLRVTESLYACDKVVDPHSPATGGGHAVAIVGHQLDESVPGGGYFIIKNSWSDKCGDNGYQYMPFNYCERSDMYCIMWEIKSAGFKF